ncbi:MAG: S-adenosylmethionine decarboxylase family protein [Paracoccaceae bacterium]
MWGQHLILDMGACDRAAVTSAETIRAFVKELVDEIEMKAYGEPIIEHFAEHSPEAAGYSLVQLIETSNICAHFSDLTGDVYLDVFSCKPFSDEVAIRVCKKYFKPRSISKMTLQRGISRETECLAEEPRENAEPLAFKPRARRVAR